MSHQYDNLHEIIELPRIIDDDIIPDHESHIIYLTNPAKVARAEFVPIIIPGFQWDYLWWIYRLTDYASGSTGTEFAFPKFLNDYLENVYREYLSQHKNN